MKELHIGELRVRVPVVQGGMGIGISLSSLASAVANQGGIGVIATAGIGMGEPDLYSNFVEANIRALRREIQKAREKTKGVIGVNVMVAMSNFADMVKTAVEEKIDIIFSGAGLPLSLPEFINKTSKTKIVPIVSSGRAARLIAKRWTEKYSYVPDAIVVEGPLAGGHLGFKEEQLMQPEFSLKKILQDVIAEMSLFEEKFKKKIPVIAGGGIYTGKDIYHMLKQGASGVQMATRFVTTKECDAAPEFKNTYIEADENQIGIIKSPVGLPGRAIVNQFVRDVEKGEKKPFVCPYHCIVTCDYKNSPYCIALALMNAKKGHLTKGFAFAGANAYRAEKINTVKEVFDALKDEYTQAESCATQSQECLDSDSVSDFIS
jgi:nitronate monooxygenase